MTWTYGGDPSANDRDWIRHRLGDVLEDSSNKISLSDEEIAAEVTDRGDKVQAAVYCCKALMARAARLVDGGPEDPRRGEIQAQLRELMKDLAVEAAQDASAASLGGISVASKDAKVADTDNTERVFSIGQDTYS